MTKIFILLALFGICTIGIAYCAIVSGRNFYKELDEYFEQYED